MIHLIKSKLCMKWNENKIIKLICLSISLRVIVSVGLKGLFDKKRNESVDLEVHQKSLFPFVVLRVLTAFVQELTDLFVDFNLNLFQVLWKCFSTALDASDI